VEIVESIKILGLSMWDAIGLARAGLILNIVGTLMVAFSFGSNPGEAHQYDRKGRRIYLAAYRSPKLFWCGIGLLVLGFTLQIFSR
jgi:hypothetical protein